MDQGILCQGLTLKVNNVACHTSKCLDELFACGRRWKPIITVWFFSWLWKQLKKNDLIFTRLVNFIGTVFCYYFSSFIFKVVYQLSKIQRAVLVKTLDCFWRDHLVNMNRLSSAVYYSPVCLMIFGFTVVKYLTWNISGR